MTDHIGQSIFSDIRFFFGFRLRVSFLSSSVEVDMGQRSEFKIGGGRKQLAGEIDGDTI